MYSLNLQPLFFVDPRADLFAFTRVADFLVLFALIYSRCRFSRIIRVCIFRIFRGPSVRKCSGNGFSGFDLFA